MNSSNIFRINEFSLLKFSTIESSLPFYKVNGANDEIQYIDSFEEKSLEETVWGFGDFKYRLNKVYTNPSLYTPEASTLTQLKSQQLSVMLKQGFNWDNDFGLLLVIRDNKTKEILISKILYIEDFKITDNQELIDGSFWLEEYIINIPKINNILEVDIIEIKFSDIESTGDQIGYIYNYPSELIPLISEKPIPDFIFNKIELFAGSFLRISLYTTENKTIEQSIIDYFGVDMASITVRHIIKYGFGGEYKTMEVVNSDDKYLPVEIGLNLVDIITEASQVLEVFVSTEIMVDGKLMKREQQITKNIWKTINPLIEQEITHPTTNYPVEIKREEVINQEVIKTEKTTEIRQIFSIMFSEIINDDIVIHDNKAISFDKISFPAQMQILNSEGEIDQVLMNELTSDNKYYFNLAKLNKIGKDLKYTIINIENEMVVAEGTIKPSIRK